MINNKSKVKWPIRYTISLYKIEKKNQTYLIHSNMNTKKKQIQKPILEIQWTENKYRK
jgi:hypothetical protein